MELRSRWDWLYQVIDVCRSTIWPLGACLAAGRRHHGWKMFLKLLHFEQLNIKLGVDKGATLENRYGQRSC
jgi:hypothetical protein